MLFSSIVTLGLLAGLSSAAPASSYIQHERRDMSPHHTRAWVKRSKAPVEALVPVRIALNQRNLDGAHDLLMDISNPASDKYGQHLSPEEIGHMFAPSDESVNSIKQWLHESGIDNSRHHISPGKGYLKFDATIDELQYLLQTEYNVFTHAETGEEHVACDDYHLPEHVSPLVHFVTPTVNMRPIRKSVVKRQSTSLSPGALPPIKMGQSNAPASLTAGNPQLEYCFSFVTIDCIRALYDIPVGDSSETDNELGIFENGDIYDQADLNSFFGAYTPEVPQGTHPKLDSIDGGEAPVNETIDGGGESLLDFELSIPLIWPQTTILYQVDALGALENSTGFGDTFLDALDASFCTYRGGDNKTVDPHYPYPGADGYNHTEMCGTYKPTNVISVSYGLAEFFFNFLYEDRQCQEYMKLGLAGTSVIYASGDSGVGSRQGCIANGNVTGFAPNFPASCPYVTSVGATQIKYNTSVDDPNPEEAVSAPAEAFYSGGGFSNYWARPSYQTDAVQTYLDKYVPDYPAGTYNKTGRGYPDVSAVGLYIATYTDGLSYLEGGTSASAPIFASIVTLINEKRLAAGKGTAGFLNPLLYAHPEVFRDVTSGNNPGCETNGFTASPGWDPVTGLGTPNATQLIDLFTSLY